MNPGSSVSTVRVLPTRDGLGVFAARALAPGDFIARSEGVETSARTRMSLQFGAGRQVEPAEDCPLRFLNHACAPNAAFGGPDSRSLFATANIAAGAEITIDYNAHEDELSHPFACGCGAPGCVGWVRGGKMKPET